MYVMDFFFSKIDIEIIIKYKKYILRYSVVLKYGL